MSASRPASRPPYSSISCAWTRSEGDDAHTTVLLVPLRHSSVTCVLYRLSSRLEVDPTEATISGKPGRCSETLVSRAVVWCHSVSERSPCVASKGSGNDGYVGTVIIVVCHEYRGTTAGRWRRVQGDRTVSDSLMFFCAFVMGRIQQNACPSGLSADGN